jgi:antitoxin HicB
MVAYACRFEPDPPGFVVTCRDLPVVTAAETPAEATRMAADAIATVLSDMAVGEWPQPSPPRAGEQLVTLPPLLTAKAALWAVMGETGVDQSELARRLGCDEKEVRRLMSFRHRSPIDRIAAALAVLGKRIVIDLADAA